MYGSLTIRLDGEIVDSSAGVRAFGNQAWSGWRDASTVNGAINSPSQTRCSSMVRPARAAMADSMIGYTWCGAYNPAALLMALSPVRSSPTVSSLPNTWPASGTVPAALPRRIELPASAPTMSTASEVPAMISAPSLPTRYSGVLPPTGQLIRRPGRNCAASAIRLAGWSRCMIRMPGVATVSMRSAIGAPASANARRVASAAKSIGSTISSERLVISPTATSTGVRGSTVISWSRDHLIRRHFRSVCGLR